MAEIKILSDAPVFAVDDDPMFQEILAFAYTYSDVPNELVILSSGYECVEKLTELKTQNQPLPSLILMDINMPGMSGIETVHRIRDCEDFKEIPIITMLSSSNETLDMEKAQAAGANDYCEKPFDITTLKFVRA